VLVSAADTGHFDLGNQCTGLQMLRPRELLQFDLTGACHNDGFNFIGMAHNNFLLMEI
jgi:hypothetical protein